MQDAVIHVADGLAILPGLDAIVSTTTSSHRPTTLIDESTNVVNVDRKIAKWGTNNLFPQEVIREVEKNPELASTIYWKSIAIISGGLVYGNVVLDENGNERLQRVIDPRVEKWNRDTNINRYLRESTHEFYKFWNIWPSLILSNDFKTITSLSCQESAFCRWGVQNNKGLIDLAYLHANWEKGPKANQAKPLPVIDPYYQAVERLQEQAAKIKKHEWIYPVAGTSSGYTYYQLAPWNSIRKSGWLEVANAIPAFKAALMKYQITAKYHIEVPDYWWKWKFPEWDTLDAGAKQKKQSDEYAQFTKFLSGAENTGKTIFTTFKTDSIKGTAYAGWKITAIEGKIKDGAYIEDSQEASSHIFFSLGVDPSMIGTTPGKGMGAGSGSDKRVAYNIYMANSKPEQDILLEPVDFAYRYNGFTNQNGEPYTLWFKNYWVTTLDQGKETQEKKQ
ncbi:MAG: hypothetical protein ACO1OF_16470 [Adhaeribacter sp.]